MDRRLDMGWIELGVGRMIDHNLNRTVGVVDHGRVGWGTVVEQMIEVGSWEFDGDSLRTALTRCPESQPVHTRFLQGAYGSMPRTSMTDIRLVIILITTRLRRETLDEPSPLRSSPLSALRPLVITSSRLT